MPTVSIVNTQNGIAAISRNQNFVFGQVITEPFDNNILQRDKDKRMFRGKLNEKLASKGIVLNYEFKIKGGFIRRKQVVITDANKMTGNRNRRFTLKDIQDKCHDICDVMNSTMIAQLNISYDETSALGQAINKKFQNLRVNPVTHSTQEMRALRPDDVR